MRRLRPIETRQLADVRGGQLAGGFGQYLQSENNALPIGKWGQGGVVILESGQLAAASRSLARLVKRPRPGVPGQQ